MKKTVIIKTGDTFSTISSQLGDFEDWIISGLAIDREKIQVADIPKGDALPLVDTCGSVVIAGSHAMVTENLAWSVAIEKWIPRVIQTGIPLLGICYGHQLVAKAMGGSVAFHDKGIEIGTTLVKQVQDNSTDSLFKDLPERFRVHACHSQTVARLPETAVRLAENDFEPTHAFRIGSAAWGVQFHPEYDERIMAAYVRNMETTVQNSGRDLSDVLKEIAPTPAAMEILRRFGKLAR